MKTVVEISAEILEDERAYKLQADMGPEGVGYLISLWLWAGRQFKSREMRALNCYVLEVAAGYRHLSGKMKDGNVAGALCDALLNYGYLEQCEGDDEPLYRLVDFGRSFSVVEKKS